MAGKGTNPLNNKGKLSHPKVAETVEDNDEGDDDS